MNQLAAPTPAAAAWRQPQVVTVRGVKPETPGVTTYSLAFVDPAAATVYAFEPGQFNMLYVPGVGEVAISISSDPDDPGTLLHTVRAAGNVTQALARLGPGAQIGLRGPFGSAWPLKQCRGRDVIIACGGIGLAPLRPVIYQIVRRREEFGRVQLLYGSRTPSDLLYADEYDQWRAAGVEVEVTVDMAPPEWPGHVGVVPVLFYRLRVSAQRTCVLTCGPEVMIHFVVFEALARRVPKTNIYLSMERNMNCAVGLCGHCQFGPKFVCKDGPVFSYDQVEEYLNVEEF